MSETNQADGRPAIAIGHVRLEVADVPATTDFFLKLGIRSIVARSVFAVLELRGGTHLILRPAAEGVHGSDKVHFDVMVDDIDEARRDYASKGLSVSDIERGSIHSSFDVTTPDGRALSVTSSHAGDRPV